MSDRIHAWLDGDLAFEALSPAEQAEARALERRVRAGTAVIASAPAPDLAPGVLAALPPAPPAGATRAGRPARLRGWLRALVPAPGASLRPALALASFTLLLGIGIGVLLPERAPPPASEPQLFVRFELEAAGATDVRLAGSFTGWEARHELAPLGGDRWAITVPLEPGVHDYVFVVDGERHVVDPYAPRVADGFGGYSSRLALLTPGG